MKDRPPFSIDNSGLRAKAKYRVLGFNGCLVPLDDPRATFRAELTSETLVNWNRQINMVAAEKRQGKEQLNQARGEVACAVGQA